MNKNFLNLSDSYYEYRKNQNLTKGSVGVVNKKEYLEILKEFMKFLAKRLLEKGEISLPERIGQVYVIGTKPIVEVVEGKIKGLAVDWNATKKLWEEDSKEKEKKTIVYLFNEETNGIRYRFFWCRRGVYLANKTLYDLDMTRTNKRDLCSHIKNGQEYLLKSSSYNSIKIK